MGHYDRPSKEEKKKKREKKRKMKETVNQAYSSKVRRGIERFIADKDQASSADIKSYIKEKHLNEKWIPEEVDIDKVASKIFDRARRKSKQKARGVSGKGVPEEKFIRKKQKTWYEFEQVDFDR
jgi:hypothetical protein